MLLLCLAISSWSIFSSTNFPFFKDCVYSFPSSNVLRCSIDHLLVHVLIFYFVLLLLFLQQDHSVFSCHSPPGCWDCNCYWSTAEFSGLFLITPSDCHNLHCTDCILSCGSFDLFIKVLAYVTELKQEYSCGTCYTASWVRKLELWIQILYYVCVCVCVHTWIFKQSNYLCLFYYIF